MEEETDGVLAVLRKPEEGSDSPLPSKKGGRGRERMVRRLEAGGMGASRDPNRNLVLGGVPPFQQKPGSTWHQPHSLLDELNTRGSRSVDSLSCERGGGGGDR